MGVCVFVRFVRSFSDGYTNLGIKVDALCSTGYSVPTTARSYACAWYGYDFLIICAMHYTNIRGTIIVPVANYFGGTGSNARPVLYDPSVSSGYDIYQNGHNAVYIKAGTTDATRGVDIYGVKLAK